jgi:hypothetical protein
VPFHCTTEQGTRELPFTVSVNVAEPEGTEVGVPTGLPITIKFCEVEAMMGGGILAGVVMVKGIVFDIPDIVETETPAVP